MSANVEALKAAIAEVKRLRPIVKAEREAAKAEKIAKAQARQEAKVAKAQAKALKQEQAIFRAQARLEKLLSKKVGPVGTKAKAAAKRPSKAVVTVGAEANAIAAAIMAKKASA